MKYKNIADIESLVESFERGTISEKEWRHAEHLIVGLYYLENHDFDTALSNMRNGIFNLLRAFRVDLTKEMPYHETLTVFWMKTVENFRQSRNNASIERIGEELIENFEKDYPLKFYSRDLLFSDDARARYIEGDL